MRENDPKFILASAWARSLLLVGVITGLCLAIPQIFSGIDPSYHHITWRVHLTFRITMALLIVLVGTFIGRRPGQWVCLGGLSWAAWEFIDWYVDSWRVEYNLAIGGDALAHKAGLTEASWWHVLLLFVVIITLLGLLISFVPKFRH